MAFEELGSQEQVLDCKTPKFLSVQAASKQKVPTSLFVGSYDFTSNPKCSPRLQNSKVRLYKMKICSTSVVHVSKFMY